MFTFSVSFFMAFLTQELIYTRNIWFHLVFGSYFEQNHLLKLIYFKILCEKMTKRWRSTHFHTKTDAAQNLIDDFFLTLIVRGPFHRKDFKWKKLRATGLISEEKKQKFCAQNLTKEWKQPPVVILQQAILYSIFILHLWLRIIGTSNQDV